MNADVEKILNAAESVALEKKLEQTLTTENDARLLVHNPSLQTTIDHLVNLSLIEYGQQRTGSAKDLGVPVGILDQVVKDARKQDGYGKSLQGNIVSFTDIKPSPNPVDGNQLLQALTALLAKYLVLPAGAALMIALWVLCSFAHDLFEINPRLAIRSPEKQCGKTTLLELLSLLVPRALLSSNCTPATIFRIIETSHPTLLIDEMDTFVDSHEELRGILNSGHTRAAACVIRTVGDQHEPRVFSTWCPMALAAIGKLPDTLEDRSLRIDLQRKKKTDAVSKFPRKGTALTSFKSECATLQRQCVRWVEDHAEHLAQVEPVSILELSDRANDNWSSLLAIAETIGDIWPQHARAAAVLVSQSDPAMDTIGVALLADIREIFDNEGANKLPSHTLCERLVKLEERPWATNQKGKPIDPTQLARFLKGFGIHSRNLKMPDGKVPKGYLRENFEDAWARYCLPAPETPETAATPLLPA